MPANYDSVHSILKINPIFSVIISEHEISIAQQDPNTTADAEYAGDNTVGTFEFVTTSDYQNSIGEASLSSSHDDYMNIVKIDSKTQSQRDDDEDYDRMFLLSLLPMMRKLSEEKKLDVRIQMQQSLACALHEERMEK